MRTAYFVGTSGWVYPHWRGPFYPQGIPQDQELARWADKIVAASSGLSAIYAYFNNDVDGAAVANALSRRY